MTPGSTETKRLVLLSLLSASGLVLFVFESTLPLLPWFRPGLGNIATIIALMLFGFSDGLKVTILRIVLGALVLGRLLTPVFILAFSGGLASVFVMGIVRRYTSRRLFGPVGISVFGAVSHNLMQLCAAYLLFVKSLEIFILIPLFLGMAVLTGTLTGLVAAMILERITGRNQLLSVK